MSIQEKCRVLDHKEVAPKHYKLTLFSSYISSRAEPGQFVNVRCSQEYDPLLRRPFSIHRVSKDYFELLYEVVGKGTEQLSKQTIGSEIDVLGPLGSGFKIDGKKQIAILAGGGMGVAPLLLLAETLKDKVKAIYVLIGCNCKSRLLCEQDFKNVTDQVLVSTDDGSYGKKGFVSDTLLEVLNDTIGARNLSQSIIYACGPKPMLKAIADISFQKKIDCQVSMEERMACGIGTCLGCVVKTKDGYKKVCDDGPVFDSKEIIWQD
ncbi:MAG: dihydroorotate dehydrogenase electron transfer subunit [Candidatus Margulisbacteria bacterium]|nr:dihydroorotate dehydrogenase electron transfer subunit [Candidatus Margulisiibacteriota bacterium]